MRENWVNLVGFSPSFSLDIIDSIRKALLPASWYIQTRYQSSKRVALQLATLIYVKKKDRRNCWVWAEAGSFFSYRRQDWKSPVSRSFLSPSSIHLIVLELRTPFNKTFFLINGALQVLIDVQKDFFMLMSTFLITPWELFHTHLSLLTLSNMDKKDKRGHVPGPPTRLLSLRHFRTFCVQHSLPFQPLWILTCFHSHNYYYFPSLLW